MWQETFQLFALTQLWFWQKNTLNACGIQNQAKVGILPVEQNTQCLQKTLKKEFQTNSGEKLLIAVLQKFQTHYYLQKHSG